MKKVRHPSPAMVISVIALVVALCGTAVAGGALSKKKVKKLADNQITARAPGLSVDKANTATSAGTAAKSDNVLWAVVSDAGTGSAATLSRSSVPVTVTDGTGVNVDFGRNVTGCSWTATKGDAGTATSSAGWAQTQQANGAAPNGVNVRTRDSAGALDELDFHLVVIC